MTSLESYIFSEVFTDIMHSGFLRITFSKSILITLCNLQTVVVYMIFLILFIKAIFHSCTQDMNSSVGFKIIAQKVSAIGIH